MREKKEKILIVAALLVAIVGLSLGFAAFSNTLSISSTANITADSSLFSVKFSKVSDTLNESNVVAYSNPSGLIVTEGLINNATNPTLTGLNVGFTDPGQTVVYRVYARNTGNYVAHLTNLNIQNISNGRPVSCTSSDSTITQDLLDAACNGINISVKVGEELATSTSTTYTNHALAKGTSELVEITISYASTAPKADGNFTVSFGDISLTYSTVEGELIPTPIIPVEPPNVTGNDTPTSCFVSTTPGEINDYLIGQSGCDTDVVIPNNLSLPVSTVQTMTYNATKCMPYNQMLSAMQSSCSNIELLTNQANSSGNYSSILGTINMLGVDIVYSSTGASNTITKIGNYSLAVKGLNNLSISNNITSVGAFAVAMNNLTTLSIPNSVSSIETYAFAMNQQLTTVRLGNGVRSIGDYAFQIDNINSLTLNDGLLVIGNHAFGANNLSSVTIPSTVTTIGQHSFAGNGMTSVTIGDANGSNITSIGASAFGKESYSTIFGLSTNNALTSVRIYKTQDDTIYNSSNSFGWAEGYSNTNIEWLG